MGDVIDLDGRRRERQLETIATKLEGMLGGSRAPAGEPAGDSHLDGDIDLDQPF